MFLGGKEERHTFSMIAPKKSKMAAFMKNLMYCLLESSFLMSLLLFS